MQCAQADCIPVDTVVNVMMLVQYIMLKYDHTKNAINYEIVVIR